MSATLDAAPIAAFLDDCPILRSEGRLFDLAITHQPYSALPLEKQVAAALEALIVAGARGRRAGLPAGSRGNPARRARMPSIGCAARSVASSAVRRFVARRAGPRRLPRPATQGDPVHQRRRKLHHRGRRHGRDRQRAGAHGERFTVVRIADARSGAHQQGIGDAAGGPGSAYRAGPRDPALHGRRSSSPPRARSAGDSAARVVGALPHAARHGSRQPARIGLAGCAACARGHSRGGFAANVWAQRANGRATWRVIRCIRVWRGW